MAKKKKHHKKQQFKAPAAKPTVTAAQSEAETAPLVAKAPVASAPASAPVMAMVPHLPLIKSDVRRVLILASTFVALELVLWYLFNHTGLGSVVYNLIKL